MFRSWSVTLVDGMFEALPSVSVMPFAAQRPPDWHLTAAFGWFWMQLEWSVISRHWTWTLFEPVRLSTEPAPPDPHNCVADVPALHAAYPPPKMRVGDADVPEGTGDI